MRCFTEAPFDGCLIHREEPICEVHTRQHLAEHFPRLDEQHVDNAIAAAREDVFYVTSA
jgi:hypothetical protein